MVRSTNLLGVSYNHPIIGKLDLLSVLKNLKEVGIKSLMVEGGQRIISSLLSLSPPVVDIVVVTIAPMFVGSDGTGVTEANQENVCTLPF